ncbi:MAG: AAA family ATPase, partial [Oscillospiraceae bacterium]
VLSEGELRFIHIFRYDDKDGYFPGLLEVTEIFDDEVKTTMIKASEMTPEGLRSLAIAKRLMFLDNCYGEKRSVWSIAEKSRVLQDIDNLVGFSEFKNFVKNLCQYIINTKRLGSKANYNAVLINNCGMDEEIFVDSLYRLYSAEGIIKDAAIITGDLDDALRTERNTPCMYNIAERWDVGGNNGSFFTVTNEAAAFTKLSKRHPIYITSMDKAQFEKAQKLDSFRSMFIHSFEVNDLSVDEKLTYLNRDAKAYGFVLDNESLRKSDVLTGQLQSLRAELSKITAACLSHDGEIKRTLSAKDFQGPIAASGFTDPYQELQDMVGLGDIKSRVSEIVEFLKKRGKDALPCLHMVFRGNPGTGKTTVARLVGRIFADAGILARNDVFVETDREGLVARYVGHTAVKTSEKVKEAMGGVLFIDEAYSLGLYDRGYDYGEEAISTLVKRMEDYRKDFVCIMAGYTDEMDKMLSLNPGLKDRVQFYIDFPDYDAAELLQIFCLQCSKGSFILTCEARKAAQHYFEEIIRCKDEHFANARLVRKIFERVRMKQVLRTSENVIEECDIAAVFCEKDMANLLESGSRVKRIGFSA